VNSYTQNLFTTNVSLKLRHALELAFNRLKRTTRDIFLLRILPVHFRSFFHRTMLVSSACDGVYYDTKNQPYYSNQKQMLVIAKRHSTLKPIPSQPHLNHRLRLTDTISKSYSLNKTGFVRTDDDFVIMSRNKGITSARERVDLLGRSDRSHLLRHSLRQERERMMRANFSLCSSSSSFRFPLDEPQASIGNLKIQNSENMASKMKQITVLVACVWLMRITHDPNCVYMIQRMIGSIVLGVALAVIGYAKKSLDLSGLLSASLIGMITIFSGLRNGLTLFFFFFASSAVTKIGSDSKKLIDEHFKEGGSRDWVQVFANGMVPTFLALASYFALGNVMGESSLTTVISSDIGSNNAKIASTLAVSFLGYFSCCAGDTFASELGVLSKTKPKLITTFCTKEVEAGTNGGVTSLGVVASIVGGITAALGWALGAFIHIGHQNVSQTRTEIILCLTIGALGGLVGSFIDSILGATIQYSGYCSARKKVVSKPGPTVARISGLELLSNSAVNLVSATAIAFMFGSLYYYYL